MIKITDTLSTSKGALADTFCKLVSYEVDVTRERVSASFALFEKGSDTDIIGAFQKGGTEPIQQRQVYHKLAEIRQVYHKLAEITDYDERPSVNGEIIIGKILTDQGINFEII